MVVAVAECIDTFTHDYLHYPIIIWSVTCRKIVKNTLKLLFFLSSNPKLEVYCHIRTRLETSNLSEKLKLKLSECFCLNVLVDYSHNHTGSLDCSM